MNFVPAVHAPENPDDNAYFFAFIKDKLLVYPTGNSARVPTLAEYRALFADDRADDVIFTVTADGERTERLVRSTWGPP